MHYCHNHMFVGLLYDFYGKSGIFTVVKFGDQVIYKHIFFSQDQNMRKKDPRNSIY